MKRNKDHLLVIASDASVHVISKVLSDFPGMKLIRANSDADAVELMVTTQFAGILLEDDTAGVTPVKIADRLSHPKTSDPTPLVFITDSPAPLDLFSAFPSLLLDCLPKPLDPVLLAAKLKILFKLFKNKTALVQSIDEMDRVYEKILDLQKISLHEQNLRKEIINRSSAFANQMQSPLKNIQAGIYQLQKTHDLPPGQGLNHIRNATQQIIRITKRISSVVNLSPKRLTYLTDETGAERPCYVLYVTGSKEEFDIFRHYIKGALDCSLQQAQTIARAKELLSDQNPDIIFIDQILDDGTGIDLLSDLNRQKSDIPVVFTMNDSHATLGAKAIANGAHGFFVKEKISTRNILAIIWETLEKSRLTKEIQGAREKIVLISRRDHLTGLYNRQCFDRTLKRETDKARRYQLPLSLLMVDFDKFKRLNQTHGYEVGDHILTTSADLIQSMVRNLDLVCRYKGEAFGILLPNTDLQGAEILAQRILKEIGRHDFDMDKEVFHVTVSIGIASHGDEAETASPQRPYQAPDQNLVKQALSALALACQQGGNTIRCLPETKSDSTHD